MSFPPGWSVLAFAGTGNQAYTSGVSADGTVVIGWSVDTPVSYGGGFEDATGRACYWTSPTDIVSLGTLPGGGLSVATACSADGSVIVGIATASDHLFRPFRWTAAGGMVDISVGSGNFATASEALGCSADGSTVVGINATWGGWTWTAAGGLVAAPNPNPLVNKAQVYGCSDDGTILVGGLKFTDPEAHATRWVSGTANDLGVLVTDDWSVGVVCSADGSVVAGTSSFQPGPSGQIFRWTAADGMTAIGANLATSPDPVALAMSPDGTIIVAGDGGGNPVLWTLAAGLVEVPGPFPPVLGFPPIGLTGVTNSGVMTGYGIDADVTTQYPLVFTPTATVARVTLADLFFSSTGDFVDLSVGANRRRFISAQGGAMNLGADGSVPLSVTPPVFLSAASGHPEQFAVNNGRGGAFALTGTLAAGASNPLPTGSSTTTPNPGSLGRGMLGDYRNGNLYAFNPKNLTDNGTPHRWLRRWRALGGATMAAERFSTLTIGMQTGAGVPDGTKPHVSLRWSDDGGRTWSDERIQAVGRLGATNQTIKFNRLGANRRFKAADRIFELSSNDPFLLAIFDADLDVS